MMLLDVSAFEGIKHGRHCLLARRTTSGSYLRACFAVALGILFLGESFTWSIAARMALVIIDHRRDPTARPAINA
jgi:hypothetical protein